MNTFSDSLSTALQLVLSGDAGLWTVVMRSLAVSASACLLACGLGTIASLLGHTWWRRAVGWDPAAGGALRAGGTGAKP